MARTARTGATEAFFTGLAELGDSPHLRKAVGSVRFDVLDGRRTRRWLVTFDHGQVSVGPAPASAEADCVVRAERAVFEGLTAGRLNAVTAVLRGDLVADGDPRLLVSLQRLFPGPRSSRRRARTA